MKKVLKYQLSDLKTSIVVFYIIYYSILCASYFIFFTNSTNGTFYNGADFSSLLFSFIIGAAIFKEHFWMVCQNGVSIYGLYYPDNHFHYTRYIYFYQRIISGISYKHDPFIYS